MRPLAFLPHEFLASKAGQLPAVIVPAAVANVAAAREFAHCLRQLLAVDKYAAQVIEWRIDALLQEQTGGFSAELLTTVFEELASCSLPILATLRTLDEGGGAFATGEKSCAASAYEIAVQQVLELPIAAIDIEHRRVGAAELAAAALGRGIFVVMSHHDWQGAPELAECLRLLQIMRDTALVAVPQGAADRLLAVKIAITPGSTAAVAQLKEATVKAVEKLRVPVIAIAMGQMGAESRKLCGIPGSAATFAVLTKATAPGQLSVAALQQERRELLRESIVS